MGQAGSVAALSDNEKQSLRESWAVVSKETKKHGIAILLGLFTAYPEEQKRFKAFAEVPLDQLSSHPKFIAHALSVVFAISSMISSVGDEDVVHAIIVKQVVNHRARGVTPVQFKNLQGVIAGYLTPLLSEEQLNAWVHAFNVFNAIAEANQ